MLGVHPNTVRAWTDQGRLRCLRINERGDRRYRVADLRAFLADAGVQTTPLTPFSGRLRPGPRAWDGRDGVLDAAGSARAVSFAVSEASNRSNDVDARELAALAGLWTQQLHGRDLDTTFRAATRALRDTRRFAMVAVAELRDGKLLPRATEGAHRARAWWSRVDVRLVEVCLREGRPIVDHGTATGSRGPKGRRSALEVIAPIGAGEDAWGVVVGEAAYDRELSRSDLDLLQAVGGSLHLAVERDRVANRMRDQEARARSLARISLELSARLEYPAILESLADDAMTVFSADRAAVWHLAANGHYQPEFTRNLSAEYIQAVVDADPPIRAALLLETGRAMAVKDVARDPRVNSLRPAMADEGISAFAIAQLSPDGDQDPNSVDLLVLYHNATRDWSVEELGLLGELGMQAGVAMKNARNYEHMATWAAQLQSIQQLGTRLNRLSTVSEIGQGICAELRQLIDYHNVRVYRIVGDDVQPVAWRGEIGEYTDEDDDQLRLKLGQGITGWVAQHGIPQYLPNASVDPRARTIPGTEEDLPESMILAPMLYEDRVLGVLVLSKLGVDQFTGDDLRYLEIYASIAAQAIANAEVTEQLRAQSERLAQQLASQRELMRVTESILTTLDPATVVEEIADRLGGLLRVDDMAISVYDEEAQVLRPTFARGLTADKYMARVLSVHDCVAGWVVRHGEAQLVEDALLDPRVAHLSDPPEPRTMIVAPLRAGDRITGVLVVERHGADAHFDVQEFELIQLFAGFVSIALMNALAHRAVEIRAQTDTLTGLKNQGTFQEYLQLAVARGLPFSLLLVDLDDFKGFNDRSGHEAGNALLAQISRTLGAACRESDEVFRYGGDEFALILPNTDAVGAMEVAAKVGRFVRHIPGPGGRLAAGVTCSIGMAAFPADGADRVSILLAADRACYVAKRSGRDRAATAAEGLALAGDILPQPPTPVDEAGPILTAA
jgi:diguanylate cyclase (GGDEF)-like protein